MAVFDFSKKEYAEIIEKIFLDDTDKKIFELKQQGETDVKIADIVGCSVSTITRHWRKIKKKVKKVL